MHIIVTGNTIRTEAQKSKILFFQLITGNKLCLMAGCTILLTMRSLQFITREVMVKLLLIQMDNVKISPMMITVAGYAALCFYFTGNMESLVLIYPLFKLFMTVQTFILGNLVH